jgi:NADH-quinone oxidoreductase subunit F
VDLRLLDAEPTTDERAAIDAFLGPPVSSWAGADAVENGHSAHGEHAARAQRHQLLPTLHALHEKAGWISPGGLNYVARRLTVPPADVYGVATFYALFSVQPRQPRVLHVCNDLACRCAGSDKLIDALTEKVGPHGTDVGGATWSPAPAWVSATARRPPSSSSRARARPSASSRMSTPTRSSRSCRARRPRPRDPQRRPSRAGPGSACCAGSASSIPRASTTTAHTVGTPH